MLLILKLLCLKVPLTICLKVASLEQELKSIRDENSDVLMEVQLLNQYHEISHTLLFQSLNNICSACYNVKIESAALHVFMFFFTNLL